MLYYLAKVMNRAVSLIACLALTAGCVATQKESTQSAETTKPPISPSLEPIAPLKFDQVTLRRNGWEGEFRSDGSASLQYIWRDSPVTPLENSAHASKGSFSIEKISKLLHPHLKQERNENSTTVFLRVAGQPGAIALHLANEDISTALWSELRNKAIPHEESYFNQLLNTYPLRLIVVEVPETSEALEIAE